MNKKTLLGSVAILAAFIAGTMFSSPIAITNMGNIVGDTSKLTGFICACKNSPTGECYEGMPGANCNHNLITNAGKNATRQYLGIAAGGIFSVLAVGNGSGAWNAGDKNLTNGGEIIIAASTMNRSQATYYAGFNNGNWSFVKTWTSNGNYYSVNATGLYNGTAMDSVMLCEGTFTAVNLELNDQLTINYTLGRG